MFRGRTGRRWIKRVKNIPITAAVVAAAEAATYRNYAHDMGADCRVQRQTTIFMYFMHSWLSATSGATLFCSTAHHKSVCDLLKWSYQLCTSNYVTQTNNSTPVFVYVTHVSRPRENRTYKKNSERYLASWKRISIRAKFFITSK